MNKTDHLYKIIGEQTEEIRALKKAHYDSIENGIKLYFDLKEARDWARWYKSHSEALRPIYTIT